MFPLHTRISDRQAIEDYTGSDHQHITFRVRDVQPVGVQKKMAPPRWNIANLDQEKLSLALEHGQQVPSHIMDTLPDAVRAQLATEGTMKLLDRACAAALPRV